MTDKMIIAYVADAPYLPYLKKSMESVRRYNKNVEFCVMTAEPFEVQGARVFKIEPDTSKFKFRQKDRMRAGVYYKFYLPKLPYDKVLYIDADVLCQRPLAHLWGQKCDFISATESHAFGLVQAQELGLPRYALTGMMLMNLKALRAANFTEQCLNKLAEVSPKWHDETIINLLFNNKINFIDKKFNYCRNRTYYRAIPETDAYILHYVGRQKRDMLKWDNFSKLEQLKPLLAGKSVAIVGNSAALLAKKQGAEIDAHDIVIRFNKGFPSEFVGNKTDICFLACTLTEPEMQRYAGAVFVRRSNLCKNACHFAISTPDRVQLAQEPNAEMRARGYGKSQASTGFIAINFALSTDCAKIDLYGFDFFKCPTYYNPAGYITLHNGNKEQEKILEYAECGLLTIK